MDLSTGDTESPLYNIAMKEQHWICDCPEGKILPVTQYLCEACHSHVTYKNLGIIGVETFERARLLREEKRTWKDIVYIMNLQNCSGQAFMYHYNKYLKSMSSYTSNGLSREARRSESAAS